MKYIINIINQKVREKSNKTYMHISNFIKIIVLNKGYILGIEVLHCTVLSSLSLVKNRDSLDTMFTLQLLQSHALKTYFSYFIWSPNACFI